MRKPKPKKRGRKPGVKVGPYKKKPKIGSVLRIKLPKNSPMTLDNYSEQILKPLADKYSPAPVLTLCGQLEDSILLLENRISNAIAKINSLM